MVFKQMFGSFFSSNKQEPSISSNSIESIDFPETFKSTSSFFQVPERENNMMTGSQFGQNIFSLPATQKRDDIIYQELMKGNIPSWMKQFQAITAQEGNNKLTYFVSPDVLCIGDDEDFLRVSLNGKTVRRILDQLDCCIPTTKISRQIWSAANLKLSPVGMGASFEMSSTKTLMSHNAVIQKQIGDRDFSLLTGHKKDIIIHNKLLQYKNNICIYGFFNPDGKPIQQAQYIAHDVYYQDYSHSIRLISNDAILNGKSVKLTNIINDKNYAYLVCDDGPFDSTNIYR